MDRRAGANDAGPMTGNGTSPAGRPFAQVDVFTTGAFRGNPLAVVLDAERLDTAEMQRLANWTNLSETTFLLPPTTPDADYRVRIFTPMEELPFAGHPTLGSCHTWLGANPSHRGDVVVQECGAGLVPIRRAAEGRLAFAAPPLVRDEPADEPVRRELAEFLRIDESAIQEARWIDNGPGWVGVRLESAAAVLALTPGRIELSVGVVGPYPPGSPHAVEVRAFYPVTGSMMEDPVTGSLNAGIAQWLLGTGRLTAPYVAHQGTALGRDGEVHVARDPDGTVWIGGTSVTRIVGELTA
jgi:PhzF family phenazine biosynthesis protein